MWAINSHDRENACKLHAVLKRQYGISLHLDCSEAILVLGWADGQQPFVHPS
jgi:hypothetical protein